MSAQPGPSTRTRPHARSGARRRAARRPLVGALGAAVAVVALAAGPRAQDTLFVDALGAPGTFTTIQAALDAAQSGDTVLVAPGLYTETIDFLGKDVAVLADGVGGPLTHVIDAQGSPGAPSGPVVRFTSGEGPGARLEGFTITGGVGAGGGYFGDNAGGITIKFASPTIRDCHVVGNRGGVGGSSGGGAGGLSNHGGAPVIEGCEFRENVGGEGAFVGCQGGSHRGGAGGVDSGGVLTLTDCLFEGNVGGRGRHKDETFSCAVEVQGDHGPGAVRVLWESAEISGCVLRANAGGHGSLTASDPAPAPGGILVGELYNTSSVAAWADVTDSAFIGNAGGAVALGTAGGPGLTLTGCVLVGNTGATATSRAESMIRLVDCALVGNSGGPALKAWPGEFGWAAPVLATGCVITGHDSGGDPLLCAQDSWSQTGCSFGYAAQIDNSILWGNAGAVSAGSFAAIEMSCVEGGYAGPGNIAADPLFVRAPSPGADGLWGTADDDLGDLRLAPGSPCIDAGGNTWRVDGSPADLAGGVRYHDDPATADTGVAGGLGGGAIVDMGPYEFGALPSAEWVDLGGALHQGLDPFNPTPRLAGAGSLTGGAPTMLLLENAAPGAPVFFILGVSEIDVPFKQGVLVPSPDLIVGLGALGASGALFLQLSWPEGLPAGLELFLQDWVQDPQGPAGFTASNALRCTTP